MLIVSNIRAFEYFNVFNDNLASLVYCVFILLIALTTMSLFVPFEYTYVLYYNCVYVCTIFIYLHTEMIVCSSGFVNSN